MSGSGTKGPLHLPLHGERLHEHRQRDIVRLPPIQDGFDDVRRQKRQPQHPTDVRLVDLNLLPIVYHLEGLWKLRYDTRP